MREEGGRYYGFLPSVMGKYGRIKSGSRDDRYRSYILKMLRIINRSFGLDWGPRSLRSLGL